MSTGPIGDVMPGPLLENKLYFPRPRRGLVARPRLRLRLRDAAEARLTLVSAPAGFGKTTLVADALASEPWPGSSAAWLSLDATDNDPATFWTYVIAALRTAVPQIDAGLTGLLDARQPLSETFLVTLLNELGAVPNDLVLVLDDYHAIDADEIQQGMTFVLDRLPPRVRLVIITRADPPLPLARLRARGELVEIRAADLRFSTDEAAEYLNGAMGLQLTGEDVAVLESRTEGWIAALQLAGLSLQDRDDASGFIAGFAGDDRYIVDYLVEEVLQRQGEGVRNFLLQTSVLDRLSGPLCDAITGEGGGTAMLEALDRGNLFVVPLDDRRRWYRYHHLFADVLRARLLDERPDRVPDLHRRASDWFEQHGERLEAINHALAGGHLERAAELIELALPALAQGRQVATMRRLLEALPDELFRVRPVLSIGHVGALMVSGDLDASQRERVERRLADAERWLDPSATGRVVVDEQQFRQLPSSIAVYRAAQARIAGDLAGTIAHARRALDLVAEDDHLGRGSAAGFLALSQWTNGDLDTAHRSWTEAMVSLEKAGHLSDAVGCAIPLAAIRIAQGRLRDALRTYERGLELATTNAAAVLQGAADMHVGLSELHLERNDLDAARQELLTSTALGEQAGLPQNAYRSRIATALVRQAEGNLDDALELLDAAERLYVSDYFPDVRPISALKARLWCAQGRISEARDWARERGLSTKDDLTYVREFEHVTLARVLLSGSIEEAIELLQRLRVAAEAGGRWRSVIEVDVLLALGHHAFGDQGAALLALERALRLAEPEGYVRIFIDEGPAMAALLEATARQGIASDYIGRLLAAAGRAEPGTRTAHGLVEPLSQREAEVLRLLATDLSGPDIARELVVSLHTVRSHTKSIYAKLAVNNRRAAVSRAQGLELLPPPR
jgi:LuxR family transcriptional regulator, maltose regulon positive regulatory protein